MSTATAARKYDIADPKLAPAGKKRILWADNDMPVLQAVRKKFADSQVLKGIRMAACLHVTAETANLVRTLKAGGAEVVLCASNPLSTQDDVAASLALDFDIPVYARHGIDRDGYYGHINSTLDQAHPNVTMDDGADLVAELHGKKSAMAKEIMGSLEETTTGVIRLRAMEKAGVLKFPVVAVNDAQTKNMFDNRYGTGQSTLDGVVRATDTLLAGRRVVVLGYGWCGKGTASRARGMGANVIVTEVDPIKALEAVMDGFSVLPMEQAAPVGDVFITVTGNKSVIRKEHFAVMKDGAIVCNSGHFNVELDLPDLETLSKKITRGVRENVDEYQLKDGGRVYVLGEGRLVNLACAKGHPASVMDMSFATQALATEFVVVNKGKLSTKVHNVPTEIEQYVSTLKLKSLGIEIDTLTEDQKKYLASHDMGT
jgi:adenosylhomocysteinase